MSTFWRDKKNIVITLLLIIYGVGLAGLAHPYSRPYFLPLTPLNLLMTLGAVLAFHRDWTRTFLLFCLTTMIVGFSSEVTGVHYGIPYGEYRYGATLGLKLLEVPLILAVNWLLLVYLCGHVVIGWKVHWALKAMASATLMVALDFVIEPVAIELDFWSWQHGDIPVENYLGWLVVGFVLQLFYHRGHFNKTNEVAKAGLILQWAFFLGMNIFLLN